MNKRGLIAAGIVGGVALFGYAIYNYIYKQTKLLQDFDYKVVGLKISTFSLNMIKGNINVVFTSKADIEFVIEQYVLNFYINGQEIGYLEDMRPFVIPAKSSSRISSEFTLNPQKIFKNITDIIQFTVQQQDASFGVKGYVKVKSNFIKVTVPIEFNTTVKEILS